MRQVREEPVLATAMSQLSAARINRVRGRSRDIHATLRRHIDVEVAAGRLTLTAEEPSRMEVVDRARRAPAGVAIAGLVLLPRCFFTAGLCVSAPTAGKERSGRSHPGLDPEHVRDWRKSRISELTNQFNALGSVKPVSFRHWVLVVVLFAHRLRCAPLYFRGRLARVHTIHAARWVFLDGGRRVLFASNYDGSLESYMDDFINKVAFGLNLAFSNGVGYPSTRWLVLDGARNEQEFKSVLRRHQLPIEVWYNGHAGLTAHHLERNARLRRGLESATLSNRELVDWCRLL